MICKGDVFLWFNNLNGASRIDVIHGLLNKCVPWELRFLGSCLEDMCKSSYEHLKKWEYIANNATELGKLESISENPMRSTLIISLALLHSSNRTCANITFNLLATQINVLLSLMANPSVADEVALLFTLALRHPAFTFEQKRALEMHLKDLEENYGQNILNILREETKLNNQTSSYEASNGEFILDIVEDSSLAGVPINDPVCETSVAAEYSPCPVATPPSTINDSITPVSTSSVTQSSPSQPSRVNACSAKSSVMSLTLPKAQIKNLELKGAHKKKKKGDKRVEYRIQVTWSNGDVTEVMKTHQDLFNFHQKLVNGEDRDRQMIYFIGPKQAQRGEDISDDFVGKMSDYLRQLIIKVPQHIRDSDAVISFFSCQQPMCYELPVTHSNESKVVVNSCDTSSNVCLSPGSPVLHHQNSLSHIQQHASNISSSSSSLSSSSPPPSQPATTASTNVYTCHRGSNDGITKVTTTSSVPSKTRVNSSPEPLSPSSNIKQPSCGGLRSLSYCSNSIEEESRIDYGLRKENQHDILRKNRNGYTTVEHLANKVRSISMSPAAVSPLVSSHNSCCTVQTQVYMPDCGSVNDLVHYMTPKMSANSKFTEGYPVSCTSPVTSCSLSCATSPEPYYINDGCPKTLESSFSVDRSSNNAAVVSENSKGPKNPGDELNSKAIGSDTRDLRVLRSRSNNGNGCSTAQHKGKSLSRQGECRKMFVDSPHASKPSYSMRCDENNGCEPESGTSTLQAGDSRPRSHSHCNIPTTTPLSGMTLHVTDELSTSSSSTTSPMLINQTVSGRQLPYYTVAPQTLTQQQQQQQQGLSVHVQRMASRTVPSSTTGMCTSCPCSRGSATPPPPPLTQSHPAITPTPFIHLPIGVFQAFPPNAAAFMSTQSTSSFVPTANAIAPPSFPFLHSPDGMTPELAAYPSLNNPFHVPHQQQQPGGPSSQQRVHNVPPGFVAGPTPNVGFHGTQMPPSPIGNMTACGNNTSVMTAPHVAIVATHVSFNPTLRSQKSTCYNCGVAGHHGLECPETTMEELSKGGHFELSYIRGDKSLDGCE